MQQIKVPGATRRSCHSLHQQAVRCLLMTHPDPLAADRGLQRVLSADPGCGDMRRAAAGYGLTLDTANKQGIDLPVPNN